MFWLSKYFTNVFVFHTSKKVKGFSPLSVQWWKQANSDPAVKWAHFQSLEGLSFDIPNKGCSSLLTFTLVCTVPACFPPDVPLWLFFPFLLFWNGSATNVQSDPGANAGTMSPRSLSCRKTPFSWGTEREGCPSKGLRYFWIQICILGTENSASGWTREKKDPV